MPDATRIYDFDLSRAPRKGPEDAPITIVEFSDFECSFCRKSQPTLAQIEEVYGEQVRLVWKHLPLSMHKNAPRAHIASVAAANQGKFWEFKDALFANPGELQPENLKQHAFELGLKIQQFEDDLEEPGTKSLIEADMAEAVAIDLTATPGFFINGRYIRGAKPFEDFAAVINEELLKLGLPIPEAVTVESES
jgi:protein-disulfide isomerase